MLKLAAKYEWLTACTGIEIHILPDTYKCYCCSVSVTNDQLAIDSKVELEGDLHHVLKKLPSERPLAIVLTGKGILIKKTPKIGILTPDNLNQVFPNLKSEQFYIQNFISGEHSYISVIRKEVVDDLLQVFLKAGPLVLSISLGPFPVSHVIRQFNVYGQEFIFEGHLIRYTKDYIWEDYSYMPGRTAGFPLKIDTEPISEKYVLAYAAALQLALYDQLPPIELYHDHTIGALREFKEERRFKFRLALILGGFFLLLLINFVLFSYYSSENNKLVSQVSQSSADIDNLQKMEDATRTKEKLLKDLGWNRGARYAWLCDQIGQTVPASVFLNELIVNPAKTIESNTQRKEIYDTGKILINATCSDLQSVNDWIFLLKNRSWVKQVVLEKYAPADDEDSQEFNIAINY